MTTRMPRILLLLAVFALLASLAGCGGGGGDAGIGGWAIDDQLFTPNFVANLDGALYHWSALPMTVSFHLPVNWNVLYPGRHTAAVAEWNGAGVQMIQIVAWGSSSNTTVEFVDQLEAPKVGTTAFTYNPYTGRMASAEITISLRDAGGNPMEPDEIQAVMAHEIGHALGIGGHSGLNLDLMYPSLRNPPQTAQTRDLNTMKTAYPSYFGIPMVVQEPMRGPEELVTKVIE